MLVYMQWPACHCTKLANPRLISGVTKNAKAKGARAQQLYRHQHLLGSYDPTCCSSGTGLSMVMTTFTLSHHVTLTYR